MAAGALLVAALLQSSPAATLSEADALYARRAEGAKGAVCDPAIIDRALLAYRQSLQGAPNEAEPLFKLLRALHFKGAFCGAPAAARSALFDEGRLLGQAFVDRVERGLPMTAASRTSALRKIPHAADVYFWTAACWGQWALARGTFASARQGVAGRLRDLAQTVIDLDPLLEEGGGQRVLGRLHHQAPKIPLITGWISRTKATLELRLSYAMAPQNSATRFFLADAILDLEPKNAEEARRLLRECVDTPPRPEYLVEDRFYADEARRRLAGLR